MSEERIISSIKAVAKRANVSIATVSHVINKTRFVSTELVEKVEDAIRELNYRPRVSDEKKRRTRTGTIGLIIPDSSNPIFANLSSAIENYLLQFDYTIQICNTAYDINREVNIIDTLRKKMVDGILFIPCTDHLVTGESFQKFRTPLVSIDRRLVNVEVDTVEVDYERASYQAAEHLIGLGHSVFSYIDRPYEQQHSILRKKGFWKAIEDHRADPKQQHILRAGGFDYEDGARALDSLLQLDPKPTAVIVFNDIIAIGLLSAAIRRGLSIPRDLSIIGYGDIPVAKYLHPSLTTVSYPTQKIAAVASELILERINEPLTRAAKTIKVFNNHMLQVRETTEQLFRKAD